jgi:hypothetical protein
MKRQDLRRVQWHYERLRADQPLLPHKELWRQAEHAAASNPDAFDEDVSRPSITQQRSPRRTWITVLIVVLTIVAVVAFRFLYWSRLETDRAAVAAPVGTTTVADILRDYGSYEGQVWTLEGVIGGLDYGPLGTDADQSPRPTVDPLTTTTRPAGSWVTIDGAVAFPSEDQMDYTGDLFLRPQFVSLTFTYPTQTQVRDGDRVRVTCRIVGTQPIGFMEGFNVAADVCRSLVVLDD